MNGSGGAWLDYDKDGDWDLYLVNCQGDVSVTNSLYENQGGGIFIKKFNSNDYKTRRYFNWIEKIRYHK